MMLMRTDPFRELDRLTQQVFGTAARPAAMPMDVWQEDGEFVADLAIALCQQVLWRGTHHDPVNIDQIQAEQAIPDSAADAIGLIALAAHCNPGRLWKRRPSSSR